METIACLMQKRKLTRNVPLEKTIPSLNCSLDKEFSLQVLDPGQRERDIFPHIL